MPIKPEQRAADLTGMTEEMANRITIPRWTIQREPLQPACPWCRTVTVRVRVDRQVFSFCECEMVLRMDLHGGM